ncbi:MAG TPA: LLM class F420-dependent oxidoreductase [Candidatus Binataceae bacterium]|nr:LLM class F420-dependent oxidoreductase [Candidatus Binataceae bacterium]
MMKIGVLAFIREDTPDAATVAKKCEALGFESMFIPEHPIIPVECKTPYPLGDGKIPESYAHMPDPFVLLGFAAAATKRVKLGTGICLVPERDPIVLAKEVATLDYFSGGRFLFGIGAGWLADETEIMGVEFKKRWKVTHEYVRAMKAMWTEEQPSFSGEFVSFPKIKSYPKPVQKPHPPIHLGAGGLGSNQRALKMTVAYADGWAPIALSPERLAAELATLSKMCADAGRDFSKIEISIFMEAGQGEPVHRVSDEAARKTVRDYQEAGAHRLIFLEHQAGNQFETDLEVIAKKFIHS